MIEKKTARLRRAAQTRRKIHQLKTLRLAVHRTNAHIYVQLYSSDGGRVLTSASTAEKVVRAQLANGGNKAAATAVGRRIAERAPKTMIAAPTIHLRISMAAPFRGLRPPRRWGPSHGAGTGANADSGRRRQVPARRLGGGLKAEGRHAGCRPPGSSYRSRLRTACGEATLATCCWPEPRP